MKDIKPVTVAHFVWLPYGIDHFKEFVHTYKTFPASYPHQLAISFNGIKEDHPNPVNEYKAYLAEHGINDCLFFYSETGQDIETYKNVAAQVQSEYMLVLNMFSRIQASHWLKYYMDNMKDAVGIISATGSFQSYYSSVYQKNPWYWETGKSFTHNFRKYKLFLKAFFYWRLLFKAFPNPHLRTNAFMVRPKEFINLKNKKIDSKFKAYQFENGRHGLTVYYQSMNMKTLVMDKNGKTYEPADWVNSSTFWINDQENLLVSDNQTRIYQDADRENRKSMTKLAWGKT